MSGAIVGLQYASGRAGLPAHAVDAAPAMSNFVCMASRISDKAHNCVARQNCKWGLNLIRVEFCLSTSAVGRLASFFADTAISMAGGQPRSGDSPRSTHGTLIIFARRDGRIAVAADSREVMVPDNQPIDACKLRLPKPTILLAINGRATLTQNGSEIWNGLDSANTIFRARGVESEQSI